jgi:DNA-directed RNA polymerase subunit RPC12/RpoP
LRQTLCKSKHRWVRGGRFKKPVGLEEPLPDDRCFYCYKRRILKEKTKKVEIIKETWKKLGKNWVYSKEVI